MPLDNPAQLSTAAVNRPLLDISHLHINFRSGDGEINVIHDVSLAVQRGETLALVGESGSGKSVTALSINQLLAVPPARITGGAIVFDGSDLLRASRRKLRGLRGKEISMIFQEPLTSLHPTYSIEQQIVEILQQHSPIARKPARAKAIEMLTRVRIPDPERRIDEYPHKMSGGMRQRIMIAMALACNPKLLIADELTTALDVTVQAQILDLLRELQAEYGIAILLITHDLNVVAEIADRVAVMYSGRIVEQSSVLDLFDDPQHPYTVGLLAAAPSLDRTTVDLPAIAGQIPDPADRPSGCQFHPRCPFVIDQCRHESPPLREIKAGHFSACWRAPLESLV
jgi:peptide/nickel transport system ATP-binding protein